MNRIVLREAGDSAPAAAITSRSMPGPMRGLAEQKGIYEELGYTDCSEIKDRNYFHSIYRRWPGRDSGGMRSYGRRGIRPRRAATTRWDIKCCCPLWFEERRDEIMADAGTNHDSGKQLP